MTQTQIKAIIGLVDAIGEAVAAAGPQGIPSGHLYAAMMGLGCSLAQFNGLVSIAVKVGKITQQGFILRAC